MPAAMLDSETLGVTDDAVILTLGIVKFDPYTLDEPYDPFYLKIDIVEQQEKGRTIDPGTVEWWGTQPQEAQDEALGDDDRISMIEVTKRINKYLVGVDKIWAQGPIFDISKLEHFYRSLGIPVPWNYWQIRDARTVGDMGDNSLKKENKLAHNALADAYCQAIAVQHIYAELKITRR